ncbi:MAG: hypothetical protein ACK5NS_04130 [Denitromonas sp.]
MESLSIALSTIGAASQFAKGIMDTKVDAAVAEKVMELRNLVADAQTQLLAAQSEQSGVLAKLEALEKENARLKAWGVEKERYALVSLAEGTHVHRLKVSAQNGEPIHDLCPKCYADSEKGMLTYAGLKDGHKHFVCSRCKQSYLGQYVAACADIDYQPRGRMRGF